MKKILFLFCGFFLGLAVLVSAIKPALPLPPPAQHPSPPLQPTTHNLQPILHVPILVYHHIGTPLPVMTSAEKSFFIEPEWFEKHIQYLKDNNFQTIRFEDIDLYFKTGAPIPERAVIISFDDGWKSALDTALPILQKYDMTATVFIPTKLIAEKPGKGMRMNWGGLEKLRDTGWEIGSHSLWHPYLTKSRKIREEIFESKKTLEEKLGIVITTFAYPFGDYNKRVEQTVREAGYTTARSFASGYGITRENLFHIPVVRMWANVGLDNLMRAQHIPLFPY